MLGGDRKPYAESLKMLIYPLPRQMGQTGVRKFLCLTFITPQPLRAVGILFSPMVSGWAGGRSGGRREIVCPGCISGVGSSYLAETLVGGCRCPTL